MALQKLLQVLVLVDFNRSVIPVFDFHAKKLSCNSQVFHFESGSEALLDGGDFVLILSCNNKVVNIEGNVRSFAL